MKFSIYLKMEAQGVYHLLNSYKTKEKAEQHELKAKDPNTVLKILEVDEPKHNIPLEEFEKLWSEQQPVAVS